MNQDIQASLPEPSAPETIIEIKEQDFAAMNGAKFTQEKDLGESSENPIPEEIVTARAVSQSPLLKMGVIALIVFAFVAVAGALVSNSMNALNFTSKKTEPVKVKQEEKEVEVVDETGKDKTALALTSQNYELKKIRDEKPTPTPTPSPTTAPSTPTTPARPTQPIQRSQRSYPVATQPPAPKVRSQPTKSQPQAQPKNRVQSTPSQPKSIKAIAQASSPQRQINTASIDPMQQWLVAANAGSFTAISDDSVEMEGGNKLSTGIEGGVGVSDNDQSLANAAVNESSLNYNKARVLVGSTTEGKLETPIAWVADDTGNQNYLIKISKPLKSSDGNEALSAGSYLVAQIVNSNEDGFAQLRGVSVLINSDGATKEQQLPENAVLVMSKDGSFLKAKTRKGNNLGTDLMSAIVAGVAKAAEIQNRPTSQITTSSEGFSSSSTTNDDKSLPAAFGEGVFNSILENIKTSNTARSEQLSTKEQVFVIDAGQSVQIFVNQTFSL